MSSYQSSGILREKTFQLFELAFSTGTCRQTGIGLSQGAILWDHEGPQERLNHHTGDRTSTLKQVRYCLHVALQREVAQD